MSEPTVGNRLRTERRRIGRPLDIADICAVLNIPPDTNPANVVVLQEGEHVVEHRPPLANERYCGFDGVYSVPRDATQDAWTIIRSYTP